MSYLMVNSVFKRRKFSFLDFWSEHTVPNITTLSGAPRVLPRAYVCCCSWNFGPSFSRFSAAILKGNPLHILVTQWSGKLNESVVCDPTTLAFAMQVRLRLSKHNIQILHIMHIWHSGMEYVRAVVYHIGKSMEYLAIPYLHLIYISMDLDEDDIAGAAAAASSPAAASSAAHGHQEGAAVAMTPSSTITTATGSAAAATATP